MQARGAGHPIQNMVNNAQSMVAGGAPFMHHLGNPMQPGGGRLNNLQIVNQTGMNGAIAGLKDLIGEYEDASISNIKELQNKYPLQEICRKVFDTLTKLQAQKFMQITGVLLTDFEKYKAAHPLQSAQEVLDENDDIHEGSEEAKEEESKQ